MKTVTLPGSWIPTATRSSCGSRCPRTRRRSSAEGVNRRMEPYKQELVELMVRSQVLQFGDFVTKSGRKTPFFINTGRYKTGSELARLGRFYAQAIVSRLGTA